jgi:hypothetical protein
MKLIQLTTDLRPWRRGDDVPVPDDLADKLVASGEAINPRPYPAPHPLADQPMMTTPLRPEAKPRRRYVTK